MSGYENYIDWDKTPSEFDYGVQYGRTYSCKQCGALVRASHVEVHTDWHKEKETNHG